MRWSPSRVISAVLPSGRNATWHGAEALPKSSLPAGVSVLPLTVKIESVPSARFATSTSVPDGLIETPVAPRLACNVCVTTGGLAFRSITESLSSGTHFFGSVGSIFMAPVTSA